MLCGKAQNARRRRAQGARARGGALHTSHVAELASRAKPTKASPPSISRGTRPQQAARRSLPAVAWASRASCSAASVSGATAAATTKPPLHRRTTYHITPPPTHNTAYPYKPHLLQEADHADVDERPDVGRFRLRELLAVEPLGRQHPPRRQLGISPRHDDLRQISGHLGGKLGRVTRRTSHTHTHTHTHTHIISLSHH